MEFNPFTAGLLFLLHAPQTLAGNTPFHMFFSILQQNVHRDTIVPVSGTRHSKKLELQRDTIYYIAFKKIRAMSSRAIRRVAWSH
jgi:hypothetical protein